MPFAQAGKYLIASIGSSILQAVLSVHGLCCITICCWQLDLQCQTDMRESLQEQSPDAVQAGRTFKV